MLILPQESFAIQTTLTLDEIKQKLSNVVNEQKLSIFSISPGGVKRYWGKMEINSVVSA